MKPTKQKITISVIGGHETNQEIEKLIEKIQSHARASGS